MIERLLLEIDQIARCSEIRSWKLQGALTCSDSFNYLGQIVWGNKE